MSNRLKDRMVSDMELAGLSSSTQYGHDMPVRQGALYFKNVIRCSQGFILEESSQCLDFLFWPLCQVGQGALGGFFAFAPSFAQVDGRL